MIISAGEVKLNMLIRPVGSRTKPVKVTEIERCKTDHHNIHINGACYFKPSSIDAGYKNGEFEK